MNIVIIGATSGIGKALFEKYARGDNRIGIVGRRANLLDELCQKYPSKTITAKADITNLEEIEQAINALHKELEYIDLAIVCSGIGDINATLEYNVERLTIDTNITGWTFVIDRLYNIFVQQGHGHLVAITQINYMEALRKKAYKSGSQIYVTDIRPGLVNTAMAKGEGLFWVMPVEKVANQIITAIHKNKYKAYVTKRWHILAIINKNLPFALYKRM